MDDYPADLAPVQLEEKLYREPFPSWWHRTRDEFKNVPQNVAKQWIHWHWGYSPYGWIKSTEVHFELITVNIEKIQSFYISFDLRDPDETREHGDYLRELAKTSLAYPLGAIMERRGTWPAPPIVLNDANSFNELEEYPSGPLLIEGHQRLSIMRSSIADGFHKKCHRCWLMEGKRV